MIIKPNVIQPPLSDSQAIAIEKMFQSIFSNALQYKTGTYTGNGKAGTILTINLKALFLYIQKTVAGAGNAVFALRDQPNVSFKPGSGFIANAVTAWGTNTITLGSDADVNTIGTVYRYFAIG